MDAVAPAAPVDRSEPRLREDSCSVTGVTGRVKPITTDAFDALAAIAAREGHRHFLFINSDIAVTPAAVALVAREGREVYAFGRMEVDAEGRERGVLTTGVDGFAFDVGWWRAHRRRFRPYIVGEAIWDNVYTAIMMCHGDGLIANRHGEVRHDAHEPAWGRTLFADYNGLLSALDARYFALWAQYHARLVGARARGASEAEEQAMARDVFVWRRSAAAAAVQAGRSVKARLRFRRQRAAWLAQADRGQR